MIFIRDGGVFIHRFRGLTQSFYPGIVSLSPKMRFDMSFSKNVLAAIMAVVALVAVLFKGFTPEKVAQVFAGEQPTAYGSQEQAGFGIHRTLSLNH